MPTRIKKQSDRGEKAPRNRIPPRRFMRNGMNPNYEKEKVEYGLAANKDYLQNHNSILEDVRDDVTFEDNGLNQDLWDMNIPVYEIEQDFISHKDVLDQRNEECNQEIECHQ